MNLFDRGCCRQFLWTVSEYFLIGRTVVETASHRVYDSYHVRRVFAYQLEKFTVFGELAPHALELQVLIESIDVKQQHEGN
jgi:hypothetical protein